MVKERLTSFRYGGATPSSQVPLYIVKKITSQPEACQLQNQATVFSGNDLKIFSKERRIKKEEQNE